MGLKGSKGNQVTTSFPGRNIFDTHSHPGSHRSVAGEAKRERQAALSPSAFRVQLVPEETLVLLENQDPR